MGFSLKDPKDGQSNTSATFRWLASSSHLDMLAGAQLSNAKDGSAYSDPDEPNLYLEAKLLKLKSAYVIARTRGPLVQGNFA
jgi:hypothetical protein